MAAGDAHRVGLAELFEHTGGLAVERPDLNRILKTRFRLLEQHHHLGGVLLHGRRGSLERHG